MSFQRPSKDPTTWQAWTAHDHTVAAQRLWELAVIEFTGVHTVKVSGLLQEADVHLTRAKLLLVQAEIDRSAVSVCCGHPDVCPVGSVCMGEDH